MIKKLLFLGGFILSFNLTSAQCTEVLVNGTYETDATTGWTDIIPDASAPIQLSSLGDFKFAHSGVDAIQFSHTWASQTQTIDLLASGYSATGLDTAPEITVSEWYIAGGWSGTALDDEYYYLAELLDASDTVIASFEYGTEAAPKITTNSWQQATNTFTGYGTGLRKIRITHGGNDNENWGGFYGPIIDDSSVCVSNTALSVHENELLTKNISVYPNPSNGKLIISLDENGFKDAAINVFTLYGQKIYQDKNITSEKYELDLNVAAGVYQVEIISKAGKAYKKIVIK